MGSQILAVHSLGLKLGLDPPSDPEDVEEDHNNDNNPTVRPKEQLKEEDCEEDSTGGLLRRWIWRSATRATATQSAGSTLSPPSFVFPSCDRRTHTSIKLYLP